MQNTRNCSLCGQLVGDDHYANVHTRHKHCHRKAVRDRRLECIDEAREYDRKRAMLPRRVQARKQYRETPAGKAAVRRAHRASHARYPERRAATTAVNNAVRDGKLAKPDRCSCCGASGRIEAHHHDYSRPLEVTWLCNACHRGTHVGLEVHRGRS